MSAPHDVIGERYRLIKILGTGGMGVVWEAWDERLQRTVALKELHPQIGRSAAEAKLASDRAMREARITARLHHPHAVPVLDVIDHDGQPCLIMQYIPSLPLSTVLGEVGVLRPTRLPGLALRSPRLSQPPTKPESCTEMSNRGTS